MKRIKLFMKNSKYINYAFTGLIVLIGLIFVWRAFYGINYNDEMYYSGCLYRLFQGDAYLVQDWKIHIMSCIPLYPFYILFRLAVGSNEGIILYLRILYTIFQLAVALVCFLRLKRFGWASFFVGLIYLLFTPFNIVTLSYNTMGLGFAMLTFALLAGPKKHPVRDFILCGICLAFCILSNPFAVILYFLYGTACVVQAILCKRKKCRGWDELSLVAFLWITLGAFLIFTIFLFMLFERASLRDLVHTFIYNFKMPGHEQNPSEWTHKLSAYLKRIYQYYPYLIWCTGLTCLISSLDKKRMAHALWYILPTSITVLYYLYYFGFILNYVPTNFCVMPLAFLEFLCFWLLPKKELKYFWLWFIPGVLYSLCSHFSSDTGILCITSSFVLCSSIGALFFCAFLKELLIGSSIGRNIGKAAAGCIMAVLTAHICINAYLRISFFYNEAPLPELTTQVNVGPAKGLYTSSGMAAFHTERIIDLESLSLTPEDTLLVLGMEPWAYLCTDATCASYTCWGIFDEFVYKIYLNIFPEKYPTVIYCTDYEESLQNQPIIQEFLDQGYEVITLESATALVKN